VRDRNSRILFWGPGAADLYGWSAKQALGRISHELLRTEFPIPLPEIEAHVNARGVWTGELVHTTRSGERKWIASRWFRTKTRGADAIVEANSDITAIKKLTDELREALSRLMETDRLKDMFLAMVSHELRSPLNTIVLAAETARRMSLNTSPDDPMLRVLENIVRASRQQSSLIEDLLDASRIRAGTFQILPEHTNFLDVARSALVGFASAAEQAGISFVASIDEGELPIYGDPRRLEQIISNLVENALKFTRSGGTVEVIARRADGAAQLIVRDTGIGIDPEILPRLFQPFVRASTPLSTGGLGLGLSIVRYLVEAHQGTIEVRSDGVGQGTSFHVALPLRDGSLD
jgi:two-component system CheB/CheR fusion protein